MKKLLTLALAAALSFVMGVTAFADTARLGNFVLSPDEIITNEESAPAQEETTPATQTTPSKKNPNTGAADLSGMGMAAVVLATATLAFSLKK